MNILVSACLLGIGCRYDGKAKKNEAVCALSEKHTLIPICPEQLGGRPTPRKPVEIKNGKVIESDGTEHTAEFKKGAEETLKIAKMCNCSIAILKSRSPSCGFGTIYDGTFTKNTVDGNGITADYISKYGIKIKNEEDLDSFC
jgi:uncharacterized protein YbbK (DUF523 family)